VVFVISDLFVGYGLYYVWHIMPGTFAAAAAAAQAVRALVVSEGVGGVGGALLCRPSISLFFQRAAIRCSILGIINN